MSTIGTRIRNGQIARFVRRARAEQISTATEASPADTPYWLLWSTGIVASVLCIAAFALWGVNGASTLFDMIVAFCT
jgi:hypothetical protein